jgi:hypothetical protein
VIDFDRRAIRSRVWFEDRAPIRSGVLPDFDRSLIQILGW